MHLGALSEEIDDTINFGESNDFRRRDISHFRDTIDDHKMMFASASHRNIIDRNHLIGAHFIIDDRDFRESAVIQTGKNLLHIHFGDTMRRFHQAVIIEV